jgi:phage baseplate assembly protein V
VSPLERKVGPVRDIDEKGVLVRIELAEQGGMLSPWLHVLQLKTKGDQDYWMPDPDQLVVAYIDANGSTGDVMGGLYSDVDAPPVTSKDIRMTRYKDGTTVTYDRAAHKLTIDVQSAGAEVEIKSAGDIKVEATGKASIQAASADVKATGLVNVDGAIVSLAGGGPPVARLGDAVVVSTLTGIGIITAGSHKILGG